ncbi:MAG: ImmA/IrrE family metallo-endopeptidase [Verrucomicrobiales bacterium]|nr:ImmA/IrrE family metallo-endopeptidase [Verrucomicrobiales bacterium]
MKSRRDLAHEANEKAFEIRDEIGADYKRPVNVFDACDKIEKPVRLRFVDFSMEGCYHKTNRPLIQISSLRPLGRRVFNCAHELGHHVFEHGSAIDALQEEVLTSSTKTDDEFVVDTFAGLLLMPKLGVRRAFRRRGWKILDCDPIQFFTIACSFGVGYTTLVNHLAFGLNEISRNDVNALSKFRLPKIYQTITGLSSLGRLQIVDDEYEISTVDTEVGTHLLFPKGTCVEGEGLKYKGDCPAGCVFEATDPGVYRTCNGDVWSILTRVSRYQYSGRSEFRHLEE